MFSRSLTSAVTVLLAISTSVNAQCTRNATVEAGNTCDTISQKYNVPTYQLALVNSPTVNPSCTNLQLGQDLCLGWKSMDCSTTHTVVTGDTCTSIGSLYNTPLATLYANNPQVDAVTCNNIYVGEVLCVAAEQYTYPWIQLPSSAPSSIAKNTDASGGGSGNGNGDASGQVTGGSTDVPTAVATTTTAPAASSTTTTTTTTTASASADAENVEYCADDDTSEDCVDEDELPYCDEQQ